MSYSSLDKKRIGFAKLLLVLGILGAATALIATIDLFCRAAYLSQSPFNHYQGFGYQQYFIVNQATLAPFILSGIAFLKDWNRKSVVIAVSFCLGIIPFILFFTCLVGIRNFLETSPLNYGSVFLLIFVTIVSFIFIYILNRQRSKDSN